MSSRSKQQQKFMGMAHALKKGEMKPSDASPELKKVAKSMSDKDVKDFASTSHKGLPKKVKQEILHKLKEYANKMGRDHLGGDSIPSSKKGGLRDFDGYDNVDYNKDMPMDEACWKGYKEVGGKIKNGKQVPNCVPVSESMMSTLDLMRKDSKNIRDFIKKVLSDKDFRDMKGDKDFIKYLGSMYESVTEGGIPQNWMQGRTSDYHTKLRGKDREYDDTNFDKENSGQEDLEESTDSLEYLKLLNKAFSTMPGSPKQKAIIKKLNVIRKSSGEKPLKEYGQRLDLSYLEDEEARLDGTPKPKDAIDTDLDEQTLNELGIFPIGAFLQDLIPSSIMKTTTPKDKERLKATIKDLIFTLNRFWKQHNIPYRVREK